jgi:outer membrane protein OmpA-like peptidoglycan-associated protein
MPPGALARPDAMKILYPEGVMELPESARADLAKVAAWLRQNPSVRVKITGYASEIADGGNWRAEHKNGRARAG